LIERHNRGGLAVDSGLEDEFVGRIAQLWPPHEMRLYRLDHRQHRVDEDADLVDIEPRSQLVLGESAATLASMVSSDRRAATNNAADAPVGLRIAATTTLVSSTTSHIEKNVTLYMMSQMK
jgi:hypothetical protein